MFDLRISWQIVILRRIIFRKSNPLPSYPPERLRRLFCIQVWVSTLNSTESLKSHEILTISPEKDQMPKNQKASLRSDMHTEISSTWLIDKLKGWYHSLLNKRWFIEGKWASQFNFPRTSFKAKICDSVVYWKSKTFENNLICESVSSLTRVVMQTQQAAVRTLRVDVTYLEQTAG